MAMSDFVRGKSSKFLQDKISRSVYIGNLTFEASEDHLRNIFEQVGPIVSFKIFFDREKGSAIGHAICEYHDPEIAKSAMRNLNNYDYCGRPLHVGSVKNEGNHTDDLRRRQPPSQKPPPAETGETPETISRAVASLPPEQMFELMKQMKICIQNDPNEARNMLLQNPQLAYALLQAQIVMKIVDPQFAIAMLHRETELIPPALDTNSTSSRTTGPLKNSSEITMNSAQTWPQKGLKTEDIKPPFQAGVIGSRDPRRTLSTDPRSHMTNDPRSAISTDPRTTASVDPRPPLLADPRAALTADRRSALAGDPRSISSVDPRSAASVDPRSAASVDPRSASSVDPRSASSVDPRSASSVDPRSWSGASTTLRTDYPTQQGDDKTAVLMQVLQLSEDQIAMLPPEQRQSIQILREQIARSSNPT
ncbi:DgyrCDS5831 [Dimorphilus gyrociliatus]|uniref:DgyrCDS5831 n=1 Tax=Dimorphilus gyrociliatus TaxID=2664684 RepID=A0A7I8VMQ0_9ANNE|nr:DgyrCDS5831 [Dimorphilus gyrociliatus]